MYLGEAIGYKKNTNTNNNNNDSGIIVLGIGIVLKCWSSDFDSDTLKNLRYSDYSDTILINRLITTRNLL